MSRPALVLLVIAVALGVFGWWGHATEAGRRRFDEMAGMIPWFAYCAGWGIGIVAAIWLLISALRSER